jgi:hypothetical protein
MNPHTVAVMDNADKQRAYRNRKRGTEPRQPQPHGTNAAIRRHERHGEELCEACRIERNRLQRERYERRKNQQ